MKNKKTIIFWGSVAVLLLGMYGWQEYQKSHRPVYGIAVEASSVEVVAALANKHNTKFIRTLKEAQKKQLESGKLFWTDFRETFEKLYPNELLAGIFFNKANREKIRGNSSNDDVSYFVKREIEQCITITTEILKRRIKSYGIEDPFIERLPKTNQLDIGFPIIKGQKDSSRLKKLITQRGKLKFWGLYKTSELVKNMAMLDDYLAQQGKEKLLGKQVKKHVANLKITPDKKLAPELLTNQFENYIVRLTDTAEVNKLLRLIAADEVFPKDAQFLWEAKPFNGKLKLYIVKADNNNPNGDTVVDARQETDEKTKQPVVRCRFNQQGTNEWKRLTRANIGRRIAVEIDGYIYAMLLIEKEIPYGLFTLDNQFTLEEAKDWASILKGGHLAMPLKVIEDVVTKN